MKLALLPLLALAVAPSARAPQDALVFGPPKGSSVHKRFVERTTWKLVTMEQVLDGSTTELPPPNMTGSLERTLDVIDAYAALESGVPLELRRDFEEVAGKSSFDFAVPAGSTDIDLELRSEVDDLRVLFVRQKPESDAKAKLAVEGETPSELLAGLREDLDLRALVSEGGVEEGDTWKLDAAALADVLAPGGALRLTPGVNSLPESQFLDPADMVGTTLLMLSECTGELSGEVLCTWKSTRKEGESRHAVIALEWQSRTRTDLSDEHVRRLRAAGEEVRRDDLETEMEWSSEGEGELVWDLTARRAHSLDLKLKSAVEVAFRWKAAGSDVGYQFEIEAESAHSARFEAR